MMPEEKLYLSESAEDSSDWITYHDRMQWVMKTRGLAVRQWARASWLVDVTTPKKDLCDRLGEEFEGKLRSMLMDLGMKFQVTCCREDHENVHSHSRKLAHLQEQLSALGHTISDDERSVPLMGSLSPCHDGPPDSLLSSSNIDEKRVLQKEVKTLEDAFNAARTNKPKCWAKGGEEEGGGLKKSKDDKTRGTKDTGNAAETKASSGDEPGAAIVEADDVPSEGANCRPKKYRVQVQESRGSEDKSQAEEGKDLASSVETETSCGDGSWAATVEVNTVPSGESCRSQSALNVNASLTEVRSKCQGPGRRRQVQGQGWQGRCERHGAWDVLRRQSQGSCRRGRRCPQSGGALCYAGAYFSIYIHSFRSYGVFSSFMVLSIVPLPSAYACTLRRRV